MLLNNTDTRASADAVLTAPLCSCRSTARMLALHKCLSVYFCNGSGKADQSGN